MALVRLEKSQTRRWNDVVRYPVATTGMPTLVHATGVGFGESSFRAGTRTSGDFMVTQYIGTEAPAGVWIPDAFLEVKPGNVKDQMICPGDSGGPLLFHNQVAGVASFRFVATCPEDGPGYQVNTARFAPWIADTLNELDPPGACATEDDASFTTAGGGCRDEATTAVWSAPGPTGLSQADATAYCDGLVEAGRDDWRLATAGELKVLDGHLSKAHGGEDGEDEDDDDGIAAVRALDGLGEVWSSTAQGEAHRPSAYSFSAHHAVMRAKTFLDRPLCVRNVAAPVATAVDSHDG